MPETLAQVIRANEILQIAESLVTAADHQGFVLTIEQIPLHPPAMGHYKTVASIRQKRNTHE